MTSEIILQYEAMARVLYHMTAHLKRANTLLWAASTISLLQSAAAWAWFLWGSP